MTIPYNLVSIPWLQQLLALITSLAASLLLVEEPIMRKVMVFLFSSWLVLVRSSCPPSTSSCSWTGLLGVVESRLRAELD